MAVKAVVLRLLISGLQLWTSGAYPSLAIGDSDLVDGYLGPTLTSLFALSVVGEWHPHRDGTLGSFRKLPPPLIGCSCDHSKKQSEVS
jgi:hypothetical protein